MLVENVLGAEVMVFDFLSVVLAASLVAITEPDSATDMQSCILEALVGVEVALVLAFELEVGVEVDFTVPDSATVMQRRSLEGEGEEVDEAVDVVEEVVLSVADVDVVVLSSSSSGLSSGLSEPEPEGVLGVEGGGFGPPGEGFPDGDHPPPRPQLWSDGQSRGTTQPLLPPPESVVPEPQRSLEAQPHANVGSEPSEVVTEVAVKVILLVSWPLVILTVCESGLAAYHDRL